MAEALKATGDAFLLEHNSVQGRDGVWSDNNDGTGQNWLGLQLMLVRDRLTGLNEWTNWIDGELDLRTGKPRAEKWQKAVMSATHVVREALAHTNAPSGNCRKRSSSSQRK